MENLAGRLHGCLLGDGSVGACLSAHLRCGPSLSVCPPAWAWSVSVSPLLGRWHLTSDNKILGYENFTTQPPHRSSVELEKYSAGLVKCETTRALGSFYKPYRVILCHLVSEMELSSLPVQFHVSLSNGLWETFAVHYHKNTFSETLWCSIYLVLGRLRWIFIRSFPLQHIPLGGKH